MKDKQYCCVSIDLFSGPGGLATGFRWAGILPLIAVEWTDTTVETYSVNHDAEVFHLSEYITAKKKNKEYLNLFMHESTRPLLIHGDINLVGSNMVRDFLKTRYGIDSKNETVDIVSGGAPCESFSLAGKRAVNDQRDDLFSNILRISRAVKSKMLLFENVKGLFSKAKDGKKGAIFEYICNSFEDASANVRYRLASRNPDEILLKACDYGVPQLRERLFLVGVRNDLNVRFKYPVKQFGPGTDNSYITVDDAISDLPVVNTGEEITKYIMPKEFKTANQKFFVRLVRGKISTKKMHASVPTHLKEQKLFSANTLSVHKGPGHVKRKQDLLALIGIGESMKTVYDRLKETGELSKYKQLFPNTIYASRNRRLFNGQPSFTVTSHCLDEILHPYLNRAITPREAARLQSFPDWYYFAGPYVQFHGDRVQDKYEQIGDAIPPLLAYAMAKSMIQALER